MNIILILVIVLSNSNATSISYLDLMNTKISEFTTTLSNSFTDLKNKVKNYFLEQIIGDHTKSGLITLNYGIGDELYNNDFSDLLEIVTSDSETKILEYPDYNSDTTVFMSTPQLAISHGRRVESHVVLTKDGYLLTLHRILPEAGLYLTSINETVLLHHGLLGSSADWLLLGVRDSLPYMLSHTGYDVWLANARGNDYSRGHTTLRVVSNTFWKFSWHEIAQYDLLATINYIRQLKNTTKPINYIGHSMGATALLVFLSSNPRYNKYFRMAILLAPLAFMTNIKGPLRVLMHMSKNPPDTLLRAIGKGEFIPSRKIPIWLATKYCNGHLTFCRNPLFFLSSSTVKKNWSSDFRANVLHHVPAGGSTDTILHYAQLVKSGRFHEYNLEDNEYPLNKITLPIALFSSVSDQLATVSDVLRLYFSIGNPIDHYVIQKLNFSHTDFVWGLEANIEVFIKVIDYLKMALNGTFKPNEVL